ncbi:MAG: bifunctional metallophosphatase/5'-nucleotidase, partial [Lachnospiraceae bacterium]|nr:bifunctional metallophosphatase/5'-nucleotidase [Lachnospiraceae bacterium]
IDPKKTYTVASNNYLLMENGVGYTMFDGANIIKAKVKTENQCLIDYITDDLGGVVGSEYADPYGQGRITIIQ